VLLLTFLGKLSAYLMPGSCSENLHGNCLTSFSFAIGRPHNTSNWWYYSSLFTI